MSLDRVKISGSDNRWCGYPTLNTTALLEAVMPESHPTTCSYTPTHSEDRCIQAVADGRLEITPTGEIWRVALRRLGTLSKITPRRAEYPYSKGYLEVTVWVDGCLLKARAHRLVWVHFFGPIPGDLTINHKNGVKTDNRPENLELMTAKEQIHHAMNALGWEYGKFGEANNHAKYTAATIAEIRRLYRIEKWKTTDIARKFGTHYTYINDIVSGRRWPEAPRG